MLEEKTKSTIKQKHIFTINTKPTKKSFGIRVLGVD